MDKFEMELIEFQSSSIWKQKFIDLRVDLENIKKRLLKNFIDYLFNFKILLHVFCDDLKF